MSFWSYIIPRTILRTHSRFNADIRITEIDGEPNLLIGGSLQSGKYMRDIWQKTFDSFHLTHYEIRSILVLGIGGGTAINLFQSLFPGAHIDAVEIDADIIDLARKYFDLIKSPSLRLVNADAGRFLHSSTKRYDCILVDIFSGPDIPPFVQTKTFFEGISRHLSDTGVVIFNFLQDPGYIERTADIRTIFDRMFVSVRQFPIKHNIFFFGKKK